MSTEIAPVEQSVALFDLTEAAISQLSEKYYDLTIDGIDDKEGFDLVHKGRMHIRDLRVQVKKTHKELKAPVLQHGRMIDAAMKKIMLLLLPVYQRLEETEMKITDEKERLKRIEAEKKAAELQRRIAAMKAVDWIATVDTIEPMTDEEFLAAWTIAKKSYDTRKAAEAQQAADMAAKEADLRRRERDLVEAEERLFPKKEEELPVEAAKNPESTDFRMTERLKLQAFITAFSALDIPEMKSTDVNVTIEEAVQEFLKRLRLISETL